MVGTMHGMAGSAALILLTLGVVQSPWLGMLYVLLFGLGSIAGMGLLSLAIAVPMQYAAYRLVRWHAAMQGTVGVATLLLGAHVIYLGVS